MGGESPSRGSTPAGAVFLSYASEDAAAAERICTGLRAAGIEVWFDRSELRGGEAWDRQIRKQIHDCALFIPVISASAHARVEGYFRLEWKLAVDRSHLMAPDQTFLLPVVIDDTPQADERIPDRFRELQWVRVPDGRASPAFVERVLRLLSREPSGVQTTAHPSAAPASGGVPTSRESARAFWRSKRAVLVVGAVLAVGLAYLVVDKIWLSRRTMSATVSATATASPATSEKAIAVLPFIDLSEKHDQEYFADGLAESVLNLLAKIPGIRVVGRSSSFQFKGKTEDLRRIGAALNVNYLVEGTVRASGDRIRVTAELIDTSNGNPRWAQTYDEKAKDVLVLQDQIATNLVRALQIQVALSPRERRQGSNTDQVYDLYLRGRQAADRLDQAGLEQGVAYFRRALTIDPSFGPAADALATALEFKAEWGFEPPIPAFEKARSAAIAALKLNPNSAMAHSVLGATHMIYDWDWASAEREMVAAAKLAPNDAMVLFSLGRIRFVLGQWDEAIQLFNASLAEDPLLNLNQMLACWTYMRLGRLAEAESACRQILQIDPAYVSAHYYLGVALWTEGKYDEALAEMEKESPIGGKYSGLPLVYYALGRKVEGDAALHTLIHDNADGDAMGVAECYAVRGDKDRAIEWLERGYAQKDVGLYYIKGDPPLRTLESDPRYKAFLRKMHLPQ